MATMTDPLATWAMAARALPGQTESGDRGIVLPYPGGVLVGVVDGLGHGSEAAEASRRAEEVLAAHAAEPVLALLERCHRKLRSGRGVVMSLASIRERDSIMSWVGVGDVEGLLLRADPGRGPRRERLMLRGGIVGHHLPLPHVSSMPLGGGDTLIFASDGVEASFADRIGTGMPVREMADRILDDYWRGTDDGVVVVLRHRGSGP